VSEVGSLRKRGLRALLSVRSPVPSALPLPASTPGSAGFTRRRRVLRRARWSEAESKREGETDGDLGGWDGERESQRRKGEKVTVACRRVLDVAGC